MTSALCPSASSTTALRSTRLGRTGRRATDFLWICPECDDGVTHAPMAWSGGKGYYHVAHRAVDDWTEIEDGMHKLIAVDIIAVLEQWRQIGFQAKPGELAHDLAGMLALGAPKEQAHA